MDFRGDGFLNFRSISCTKLGPAPEAQNRARREAPRPILGLLGVPILHGNRPKILKSINPKVQYSALRFANFSRANAPARLLRSKRIVDAYFSFFTELITQKAQNKGTQRTGRLLFDSALRVLCGCEASAVSRASRN